MHTSQPLLSDIIIAQAVELLSRSYAPYSNFRVSAIVKARDNKQLFHGCNVENASFGATICAERNAITSMVTVCGHAVMEWVLIMSDVSDPVPPCGMCLQVLAEFGDDELPIYLANRSGIVRTMRLKDVLPYAFRTF